MNLLYAFLTYNRPNIMSRSLGTLLNGSVNNKPEEVWILDDGSDAQTQFSLFQVAKKYSGNEVTFNLSLAGKNYGIGWNFEQLYNIAKWKSPKILGIIESDYIWRKNFIDDVLAVFEACPNTVAIAGVDHPEMYDREKTHGKYPTFLVNQFGKDVDAREHLYNPFEVDTSRGKIKVQGISNSCGCSFLNWERIQKFIFEELGAEREFWDWMDRGFHKWGNTDRRYADDSYMSGTLTYLWERWAKERNGQNGLDLSKNFAWLDICDYSLSQHVCGQGVNGSISPEGETFVVSPHWKDEYTEVDPRL